MIIADLNIICVEQAKRTFPKNIDEIVVESHDRRQSCDPVYPDDNFGEANRINGWWYTFWPTDQYFLSCPFFELPCSSDPYAIKLSSAWEKEVIKLFSYYIGISPVQMIGVLVRAQGISNNVVHDCVSLNVFREKMMNGQIKYNELYYVSK